MLSKFVAAKQRLDEETAGKAREMAAEAAARACEIAAEDQTEDNWSSRSRVALSIMGFATDLW